MAASESSVADPTVLDVERKRRIRRNAFWLMAVALAFYLGFIVLSVVRAHG